MENFGFSRSDMESIQGGLDPSGRTGGTAPDRGDSDNYARATANILAEPIAGRNRSNITNLIDSSGRSLYDPAFAAAFDISRGLDPTNNMSGTGGVAVPSYLRPQIEGRLGPIGPKYYSEGERVIQEDFTDLIKNSPSITNLMGSGLESLMSGLDFLNNSKAGKTVEDVFEEERGKEIAELEKERLDSLVTAPINRVKTSELDPAFMNVDKTTAMDAGASLAMDPNLSPDFVSRMRAIDALPPYKSTGIVSLPQADNLQNQQITAGANAGKTLNTALPERRDLNAFTSPGFLQSSVNPVIKSEVNPRDPSNLAGTTIAMPDPPAKAPPGFVDIVVQEGKTDTFPGTNMSILGGKDSSAKAYSPLTEAEAMARTDAGISLERIDPSLFQRTLGPMDFTVEGSRVGNILPAADFRVKREPEVTKRVRISDLPRGIQEIVGLRSNLDYSSRAPVSMQDILDARRAVERGDFPEQEMADFLGGFGRYAK